MSGHETSSHWTKAQVLKHLREKGRAGEPVTAQVFLSDDVAADDLSTVVGNIISEAEKIVGQSGTSLEVGKVHRLAKSFSLKADPEAMAAIADLPSVKTILPAEVEDVHPKPTKVKRV